MNIQEDQPNSPVLKTRLVGPLRTLGVVPFAFEVLGELEDRNIKGSGGLVRDGVIVIDRGIRDRKISIR